MTACGQRAPTLAAIWTGSTPTGRIRGSMAPRPNRPIWTWCRNWRRPHSMKSVVRPELSTAAAGPSQAPTAAVDNSAPRSTHPEPTYKSGKTVQITGTTSLVLHAKGVRCEMGSKLAQGFVPPADTELMARFRRAGLVLAGTTQTPEFGYNPTTETRA